MIDENIKSNLKVYPNPFSDKLNFEFAASIDAYAVLEIYNLAGQSVVKLLDQQVESGVMNRIEYNPTQIITCDTKVAALGRIEDRIGDERNSTASCIIKSLQFEQPSRSDRQASNSRNSQYMRRIFC